MSNCSLWHITNTSLLRELSSLYYLRFSCELLLSAEGQYTLGGKYCFWDGLGSPLIKCLVCFRRLVGLESILFPRFKRIVIMQSRWKLFGMPELLDNLVRFIHSNKISNPFIPFNEDQGRPMVKRWLEMSCFYLLLQGWNNGVDHLFNNLEMSKSKTQKSLFHKSKSSERITHPYPWTEKHLLELYPNPCIIPNAPCTFTVTLNYKNNALRVRLPVGI